MSTLRMICLFYRRNVKTLLPSAIITLTIFSLVGISVIAITIPFNINLKNEIKDLEYHFSTIIAQDGMTGSSFENILSAFDSLAFNNGRLGYGIVINLIYVYQEENFLVPFIGLSNDLFVNIGLSTQEIVGSSEFESLSINLTKAIPYYQSNSETENQKQYIANFSRVEPDGNNDVFSYVNSIVKGSEFNRFYSPRIEYQKSSYFLIGNISVLSELVNCFNISSRELGALTISFLDAKYIDKLTIERLEKEIDEREKNIFNNYIESGFNPEWIIIYSPVKSLIKHFEAYIGYEIVSIQLLSVANLLLVLILLFLIEIGIYQMLKKNENVLLARGFSKKKTILLFMTIEFITDLFIVILSLSVFSIVILLLNLSFSTFSFLIETYSLLFVVFFLIKLLNLLVRTKRSLETKKKEKKGFTKTIKGQRLLIIPVLLSVVLLQVFMIFEPLFWQPIIYGTLEIILDIVSGVLTLFALIALASSSEKKQKIKENVLKLQNLLSRLFSIGLKKIRTQRMVTACLYALLFFLIVSTTAKKSYTEYYKDGDLWDLDVSAGFRGSKTLGTYEQINSLTTEITEIEEMCPGVFLFGSKILSNQGQIISTTLIVLNASTYASQNLGWNHFFGSQSSGKTNDDILDLKEKTIILNQAIAENYNLKEGDNISLEVDLENVGYEGVSLRMDDIKVLGIVDTLSERAGFTSSHYPHSFVDISFYLDVCSQLGLEPQINTIGINVKFDDKVSVEEKETKITEVFNMVLDYLNLSESNVNFKMITDTGPYYSFSQEVAEQFFIYFDLIFCILFIPLITVVFTRATVKNIAPSLAKLGARGHSDQELRKYFIRRIRKSLIGSTLLGLFIGTLAGIIYTKHLLFSLLLPTAAEFYIKIGLFLVGIAAVGSISIYLIAPFSTKQIKTITEEKERKLSRNEPNNY